MPAACPLYQGAADLVLDEEGQGIEESVARLARMIREREGTP